MNMHASLSAERRHYAAFLAYFRAGRRLMSSLSTAARRHQLTAGGSTDREGVGGVFCRQILDRTPTPVCP